MTDYLWDKSGEPEEDVERLEQLLGTLRYEPRPLRLPEEFGVPGSRRPFRPQRTFSWPRLAVAASLLLTLVAGAWLLKSQHNKRVQSAGAPSQQRVAPLEEQVPQPQTAVVNNANEPPAPKQQAPASIERVNYPRPRRVLHRDRTVRRAPQDLISRPQQQIASSQPHESLEEPMTQQEREATEKLLLALRIASAKFNYAQREMQEASAGRKPETR